MIMEYTPQEKVSKMLFCSTILDEHFFVVSADDYFYNFIGKTENICFSDYVNEESMEDFLNGTKRAMEGTSMRLIIKIKGLNDVNQLVDIVIASKLGKQGERLLSLIIHNIDSIESGYMHISNMNRRYRVYLSMYSDCMFDYDLELDVITFFKYASLRPTILFKGSLQEFYDKAVQIGDNQDSNSAFSEFFQNLKNAREYFLCKIEGPSTEDFEQTVVYRIEGATMYKHNRNKLVAGVMHIMDADEDLAIPYYATAAGKDSFTGLLNKRACREYVDAIVNTDTGKHYMAVIDIDDFKSVNDTYGHLYGDEVIAKVAAIINSSLAGRGTAGRFGGDEFFIFTNGIKGELQLRSMLTSLQQMILEGFAEEKMQITLSIGVSKYPENGTQYEALFARADSCLYEAKKNGKNQFVIAE